MGLGHFPAVIIIFSAGPLPVDEYSEANPAELVRTSLASHMLACLLVLNYRVAYGTGSVLRSRVGLKLVFILLIIQFELFVPMTVLQKVTQKTALLVATSIRSDPRLHAHVAKIITSA